MWRPAASVPLEALRGGCAPPFSAPPKAWPPQGRELMRSGGAPAPGADRGAIRASGLNREGEPRRGKGLSKVEGESHICPPEALSKSWAPPENMWGPPGTGVSKGGGGAGVRGRGREAARRVEGWEGWEGAP